jgi:hypothetical protein
MDSQEQCDRMKAVCLENGLPYGKNSSAFELIGEYNVFRYSNFCKHFSILVSSVNFTQVTEAEFLELLKEYKLNK